MGVCIGHVEGEKVPYLTLVCSGVNEGKKKKKYVLLTAPEHSNYLINCGC